MSSSDYFWKGLSGLSASAWPGSGGCSSGQLLRSTGCRENIVSRNYFWYYSNLSGSAESTAVPRTSLTSSRTHLVVTDHDHLMTLVTSYLGTRPRGSPLWPAPARGGPALWCRHHRRGPRVEDHEGWGEMLYNIDHSHVILSRVPHTSKEERLAGDDKRHEQDDGGCHVSHCHVTLCLCHASRVTLCDVCKL